MKKSMKNIIIAALILVIGFNLTGCANTANTQLADPVNIAFVVGIADGETKFNDSIAEFSTLSGRSSADYAFISVEGEPTTIGEVGVIPDLSDRGYTDVMMERISSGIKAELTSRLDTYEPLTGEIDIAAATELAVRTLNANAVEGRRNVLVYYCGGKSTEGLINMLETPVYKLDVETSVARVTQNMNADMSDIDDIVWYCCGDFGADQPKLSANEKSKLKYFYEQLFFALGAKSVTFKDDLPSAECYQFAATPVSCMDVEGVPSQLKDLAVLEPNVYEDIDAALTKGIEIPEEKVTFIEDKAEYCYPEKVKSVLKPIADFLMSNDVTILLCGTTAGDGNSAYTMELSQARADAVKQSLVDIGVDPSRIIAVGLGSTDPWHVYGIPTSDKAASCNRKVVLLDASSRTGLDILAGIDE